MALLLISLAIISFSAIITALIVRIHYSTRIKCLEIEKEALVQNNISLIKKINLLEYDKNKADIMEKIMSDIQPNAN